MGVYWIWSFWSRVRRRMFYGKIMRTIFENMTDYDGSDASSSHGSDSGYDDSGLQCACGLPAKLRMSQSARNPFRLFYNCPRRYDQCDFFRWCDEPSLTGDRHADELNLIRHECTRLQRMFMKAQQDHENDREKWEMQKEELMSTLCEVQAELDEYKRKVKMAAESDLMPPVDPRWSSGRDEMDLGDDAIEIHAI
ncbi:unnamed protein product [Linum tenue]|uniref:GRF-type domain-containing protein n=1 Tax=Linum tenue TaxID=586396 RepID=A0AAV0PLK6_9ROSI|nr:unnamed protein product [Linum tenue]